MLIVGAVVIFAGFGFIALVVVQRATGSGPFANFGRSAASAVVESAALPLKEMISLGLPPGARIDSIQGAGNRVLLLVRGLPDGDRVLVVDPSTGAVATLKP